MQKAFDGSIPNEGAVWWQRRPDAGDYFCIICVQGVVIYGVILPPPDDETPDVNGRWTRTWSQHLPHGSLGYIHIDEMDFILTREQFERARELGWPAAFAAIRVVLRMQAMAQG